MSPVATYFESDSGGPGWYWEDPQSRFDGQHVRYQGPHSTKELAEAEYYAYCECMTI